MVVLRNPENEKVASLMENKQLIESGGEDLISSAKSGDFELIKSALENGANVNQEDEYGVTALMIACDMGHYEMAKLLLKKGADPNTMDCADMEFNFTGWTPALWATDIAIIELLVDRGADINTRAKLDGLSLLHKAVESENLPLVEFCVSNYADVNAAMQNGETPLMSAVKTGNLTIVDFLVSHGADVNHQDKIGISALNLARSFGYKKIESYLINSGATTDVGIDEKLVIWAPDGSGDTTIRAFAYSDVRTDDFVTHVFVCGVRDPYWEDPHTGHMKLYIRMKDGEVLDYFSGRGCHWDLYAMKEGEYRFSRYQQGDDLEQIKNSFPILYETMRSEHVYWNTKSPISPINTGIDDLEKRFMKVADFFSNFVELKKRQINYGGLPMCFVGEEADFTQHAVEFMGDNVICESSNVDKRILDKFIVRVHRVSRSSLKLDPGKIRHRIQEV